MTRIVPEMVGGLGHKIVEGSSGKHRRRRLRVRFALPWICRGIVTAWACEKRGQMATDLKGSVRRQIDRLRKELAVATGQVAALQDEIRRHELVYDMLDGRKTAKQSRQGRSTVGSLKRGPRGAMIDWTAVFATLPDQFTLDTMIAHKTAGEKPRACAPG